MKILIISNYYPPYYWGGYELACKVTADFLSSQGHTIYILTGNYQSTNFEDDFKPMSPCRKLRYINYETPSAWDKHCVEKYNYQLTSDWVRKLKPDLIYFWNMKGISIAPVMAAQDLNARRIFEIGDFWPGIYLQPGLAASIKRKLKMILPWTIGGQLNVSPAIAVSQWVGREMKAKYHSQDVYVVPNGMKIEEYEISKKSSDYPIKYMFSGRIDPEKGLDIAINAFGILVKKDPDFDFQFNVYGDGDKEYTDHCSRIISKCGLDKQVKLCGRSANIDRQYKSHDCLLMPTIMRESFGLVIIEAMAYYMTVIASNHYGPAEIISDKVDGLLFEPGNPKDLAEKIRQVHNAPEMRDRIGNAGRKKVVEKYELGHVKRRVESILLKLCEQKV